MVFVYALIGVSIAAYILTSYLPTFVVVCAFPVLVVWTIQFVIAVRNAGKVIDNPKAFSLAPYQLPMEPPSPDMRKAKAIQKYAKGLKQYAEGLQPKAQAAALVLQKNAACLHTRQKRLARLGKDMTSIIQQYIPELERQNIQPASLPNYAPKLDYVHPTKASPRAVGRELSGSVQPVTQSLARLGQSSATGTDVWIAVLSGLISFVLYKQAISKALRELSDAYGKVSVYATELKGTVELMKQGNDEVVSIIRAIDEISDTAKALTERYKVIAPFGDRLPRPDLGALNERQRESVIELFRYALMIRQQIRLTA